MKKALAFAMTMAVAFSAAVAAGAEEGERNLTVPSSSTLSTLDSVVASNSVDMTIIRSVNEGLYRDSVDGIVLSLAEKDDVSEDGLTHTFTLRDDIFWSNGDPITAQDFEYSWKRLANPDTGAEYAEMLLTACIKNAKAVTTGEMAVDELGIKAVDDKTLVVECDAYVPYFKDCLIMPCFYPENEAFVTEMGDQYGMTADNVLYSGVFKVAEWEMGSETVVLEKNEYFYDQELSNLDTLTYQTIGDTAAGVMAYESGELDVVQLNGDYLDVYADAEDLNNVNNATLYYLEPNLNNEYLANEKVRQAIAYALDKASICTDLLKNGSVPANYIVVSNFAPNEDGVVYRDYVNQVFMEQDLDKAAECWNEGLEELNVDGFSIELLYDDSEGIPEIAEFMQATLMETLPGLDITLQVQPQKNRRQLMAERTYDIALTRWGSDYNDPSTFMDLFETGNSFNYGDYSDPVYDEMVEKARTTDIMDSYARYDDYLKAEEQVLNSASIIPVYEVGRAYLIRSGAHIDFTIDSGYMYQYAHMD